MTESNDETARLRERIAFLEQLLRARESKITELGNLIHPKVHKGPSGLKHRLVRLWDSLPRDVQRRIEPFADFIDRVVK